MKKFTFRGGIHPADSKNLTCHIKITEINPPQFLYFPLNQHLGTPAKPIVAVGDYVKMYEKIADSNGFLSAPIHSSVSGTVINIGMYPHPSGLDVETIVIENDWLYKKAAPINTKTLDELSPAQIIEIVKEAGIVGMGGASFPTHVKLSPPPDKKIEYIIINGAECEPYLTSDHRVMLENTEDILLGLKCVMKVFGLKKAYVAIEENKPDAIAKMKEAALDFPGIEIVTLKKKYPQGSEKHLIYAVTKRQVPSGKLPADCGCVVLNIDTVFAVKRAIFDGIPLTRRIVTVTGSGINNPANYSVPLGTRFESLIEQSGGIKEAVSKIIIGGPMMGNAVFTTDYPVLKNTSSLLFLEDKDAHLPEESACIRCGKCVNICPMNLLPLELYTYSKSNNFEELKNYDVLDCVECGSCSYICPAKRQLIQTIRTGKQSLSKKLRQEKEKNNG